MTHVQTASFTSLDDFKTVLGTARLIFFHVYEGEPAVSILRHFEASSQDELLLMLDVEQDKGFLNGTPVTTEITETPRQFVAKPLNELKGLGAWAKGTLVDFEVDSNRYSDLIQRARAFAFGE